jgi:mannose-6-phosphate isomerase
MNIPLNFNATSSGEEVFTAVSDMLHAVGLTVVKHDFERPWGGFFVLDEDEAAGFIQLFFPQLDAAELSRGGKLSPKILVVAPGKRLSWQYHHRRAEIWRVIGGHAGVITSLTDEEMELKHVALHETITLQQGERHRLIGLGEYGIVAEIWQHTQPENPSDEDDIVRLQDDFGRGN